MSKAILSVRKKIIPKVSTNEALLQKDSSIDDYYSPESFIKQSLFLVQSDNLFLQQNKIPLIYQTFWTSVQYVASLVKSQVTIRHVPLLQNNNLGDGWYHMPNDFASWVGTPTPAFYNFDEQGNWSFSFGSNLSQNAITTTNESGDTVLRYNAIPPLNGVDVGFIMMLRWHFLRELALCQNSIAGFFGIIEARYNEYKQKYVTGNAREQQKIASRQQISGSTNLRLS